MIILEDQDVGSVVRFFWPTAGADGASITRATDGSIRIYKDASDTQRSSSAGITDTEDVDGLTGVHRLSIDLADNTDAGFYVVDSVYHVVLVGAVIDGATVNHPLARFRIKSPVLRQSDLSAGEDLDVALNNASANPVW